MPRLKDKTAIITGSSSGIGRAIAMAYAKEGAQVVINYRSSAGKAQEIVTEIERLSGRAVAIQADIADRSAVERLIAEGQSRFGRIDIWVNNAGADILTGVGAALSDEQKLNKLIEVDLKGTIYSCWSVVPVMRRQGGGTIINMSWDQAIHGYRGVNPQMFSAVKAGVQGFSKSLAKTAAPEVRVNVLAPGWIATSFANEVMDKTYYTERINEIPLKRFGAPEEVADAAVFLASNDAAYLTGAVINIGGGVVS